MSRRNPRGSSAAKRRKRAHDRRTQRPGYRAISGRWFMAASRLGAIVAARISAAAWERGTPERPFILVGRSLNNEWE